MEAVHLGEPGWKIASGCVEAHVTKAGGHLGPARFLLDGRWVSPLHVAPWTDEPGREALDPIIRVLRGDFFCMPFGANDTPYGDERHPIHGDTANLDWTLVSASADALTAELQTRTRPGNVRKEIVLVPDRTLIVQRHVLSGFSGPMNFGMHAMVAFRTPGIVSLAPFELGQVFPGEFESPAKGGYSSLRPGAPFDTLDAVPRADGTLADLTRYPAREGFEDLAMVLAGRDLDLGWSAVTFPEEGYVWFCLKDPKVLTGTVLWHSNGGRHYAPWNGRHRGVLGVEEVTSYFHYGLAESVGPNPFQAAGYTTCFDMEPDRPLTVEVTMGVASIPDGFGAVRSIALEDGRVVLRGQGGEAYA